MSSPEIPQQPPNQPKKKIERTPLTEAMRETLKEAIQKLSGALDADYAEIEDAEFDQSSWSHFGKEYNLADGRHASIDIRARRIASGAIEYSEHHIMTVKNRDQNSTDDVFISFNDGEFYIRREISTNDDDKPGFRAMMEATLQGTDINDEDWKRYQREMATNDLLADLTGEKLCEEEAIPLLKDLSEAKPI